MKETPWLLLIHQIPSQPSNLRVRIWRKLQNIGAIPIKSSIYVLPDKPSTREDFEWLRQEIGQMKGEASILRGDFLSQPESRDIVESFRKARAKDFSEFVKEANAIRQKAQRLLAVDSLDQDSLARLDRKWATCKAELDRLYRLDFFGAPNRGEADQMAETVRALLQRAKSTKAPLSAPIPSKVEAASLRGRTWVTRRSPHIDRLASAWLIRRFIDPKARFKFVSEPYEPVNHELRYDMAGGEFTHHGEWCSFETLVHRLGLKEAAVLALSEIIHDIDLKDRKFGRLEAAGVSLAVGGLRRRHAGDLERLEAGFAFFDDVFEALKPEEVKR